MCSNYFAWGIIDAGLAKLIFAWSAQIVAAIRARILSQTFVQYWSVPCYIYLNPLFQL